MVHLHTLRETRSICPWPEVSWANSEPFWGPDAYQAVHQKGQQLWSLADSSGVARAVLRAVQDKPKSVWELTQTWPLAEVIQEARPWKSCPRPPIRGARGGQPSANRQDAGFSGPRPGPGPGPHGASAPGPQRQRGSGSGSMGGPHRSCLPWDPQPPSLSPMAVWDTVSVRHPLGVGRKHPCPVGNPQPSPHSCLPAFLGPGTLLPREALRPPLSQQCTSSAAGAPLGPGPGGTLSGWGSHCCCAALPPPALWLRDAGSLGDLLAGL